MIWYGATRAPDRCGAHHGWGGYSSAAGAPAAVDAGQLHPEHYRRCIRPPPALSFIRLTCALDGATLRVTVRVRAGIW
jgi:hypothetical protein